MTNANEPAFVSNEFTKGLTKREYFAAMAMQGMLSMVQRWPENGREKLAQQSVLMAEAIIKALNEETK